MKQFLKLLTYLKPYKRNAFLNITFNVLYSIFSLFSIGMLIPVLNLLFEQTDRPATLLPWILTKENLMNNLYFYLGTWIDAYGKSTTLAYVCGFLVLVFLLKNTFRYLAIFVLAPVRNNILRDVRQKVYQKITSLHLGYFSEQKKGDIISRMSVDAQEIEWSILNSLEALFRDPLSVVLHLAVLIFMSFELTLFVFILLPVSGFIIGKIGQSLRKKSAQAQKKYGHIISLIEETLSGLRIIKGFNAETYSNKKFYKNSTELAGIQTKVEYRRSLASPTSEFLGSMVIAIIVWYGGKLIFEADGDLQPDQFIAYIAFFYQILVPAKSFSSVYNNIQKGMASAERIEAIIDAKNEILEVENPIEIKDFEKQIEFKNLSFAYEKEAVLKDISFTLPKGKMIALVGPSGSGKSTLADLLPRFIDAEVGEILIDEKRLKNAKLTDLRALMGIVSQESILFNDSVFNNIAFGISASQEAVERAAKIANAHEFISNLSQGYQTNIGDRGNKLSGGQKQRISIARAILKNPPILILDEATSALDTESEKLVQDALNKLMENRTSLVIAHRLSTIQHADEILVLQAGKIIERGKHKALIEQNGFYKKLIDLQQI